MSPILQAEKIAALLQTSHYGRSLDVREVTKSTNSDAEAAARAGAVVGHVIIADHQEAGRGSHGRNWSSPAGTDIYLSIVDRPKLNVMQLPPLTLAVGMAVADTVAEALPAANNAVQVKWPNDVWVNKQKCAGILVETSSEGDRLNALVIGIGLNVNRLEFPDELDHPATSLRKQSGKEHEREVLVARLLGHVEHWVARFVEDGAAVIAQELSGRLMWKGENVECGGVAGCLLGVASNGALELMTSSGPKQVISGRLRKVSNAQ